MNKGILLLILSFFYSFSIFANEYENVDCSKPQGNYEYSYCVHLEYEKADRELNLSYKELRKQLSSEEKKLLLNAQRSWIKYRDNHCELSGFKNRGTTGWSSNMNSCLKKVTIHRTNEFKNILKDIAFYKELGIQ